MRNFVTFILGLLLSANSQATTSVNFTSYPRPLDASLITVNNGPGNQNDPRIRGDLVTYTSQGINNTEIRYRDLVTGSDSAIPGAGVDDGLASPLGSSFIFTRGNPATGPSGIFLFDLSNSPPSLTELDSPGGRRDAASGWNSTVAWVDFSLGLNLTGADIIAYDLATKTVTSLTTDSSVDVLPTVSPDGSLILWTQCTGTGIPCNIWKAVKSGGNWSTSAVTTSGYALWPVTDGQNIIYAQAQSDLFGNFDTDIYWQPVAGGEERQLPISGEQHNPVASGNLIAYENWDGTNFDLYAFDILNARLYTITSTPGLDEILGDVFVQPSGEARIVYSVKEVGNDNIYAYSFNINPVAIAGPDQVVIELSLVTLNGTGSGPAGPSTLTYHWSQIGGPTVPLSDPSASHPTFTAPNVPRGGATLSFELTILDGNRKSQPSAVNITVKDVNHPPVADAGPPQTVQEDSSVLLDGSASYDPDSDPLTYSWTQRSGLAVTFLTPNTDAKPKIKIPLVGRTGATLVFDLVVSDGLATSTKSSVTITVDHANHPPIANAGPDQTVTEGKQVTLSGLASTDPDKDSLTYAWTQLLGPNVVLNPPNGFMTTFTAPQVGPGGASLNFQLVVNDGALDSVPDTVSVKVLDSTDLPACGRGRAEPKTLWPPTHKLLEVEIEAVGQRTGYLKGKINDQDDDLRITITQVTQDEPVTSTSDGDMKPDARIEGEGVLLRAERSPKGNGRVYHVGFTAKNKLNRSCTGTVRICVPNSRKSECKDDGPLYNSFGLQ